MTQAKHTPGPWVQDEYDFVITPNGRTLLVEGVALSGRSTPETKANARLISAAPDLLAILSSIIYLNPQLPMGYIEEAEAAIAKALGE